MRYQALIASEEVEKNPNADLEANVKTQLLEGQVQKNSAKEDRENQAASLLHYSSIKYLLLIIMYVH